MFLTFAAVEPNICVRDGGFVHVPNDFKTLDGAFQWINGYNKLDHRIINASVSTIVVGKGTHKVKGIKVNNKGDTDNSVYAYSAMNIVGDPMVAKKDILVVGFIGFEKGIKGNCHLQNLTVKGGVSAKSSFTMQDVVVKDGSGDGVAVYGKNVQGILTNVEISNCKESGVGAYQGASITLLGKTNVEKNCVEDYQDDDCYGLVVDSPTAIIQVVNPLTIKSVSHGNYHGDFGAVDRKRGRANINTQIVELNRDTNIVKNIIKKAKESMEAAMVAVAIPYKDTDN
jgi:hypothetical protein